MGKEVKRSAGCGEIGQVTVVNYSHPKNVLIILLVMCLRMP